MNKYFLSLLLFCGCSLFQSQGIQAAIARYGSVRIAQPASYGYDLSANPSAKRGHSKSGFFKKIKDFKLKLKAKIARKMAQPLRGTARQYLILFLLLLVAAIVLFAFNRYAAVFNILGSVAMIAAAVFFVLWLLEFTGSSS